MDNIDFVLLDNTKHPLFSKYSEIYSNSKNTTEPIIYYKIKVLQFDGILTELYRNLNKILKREIKKQSIKSYSGNKNISFRDDFVIFMNDIDIIDILLNLGIIFDKEIDILIRQNIISKFDKQLKHECEKIIQSTVIFPMNLNNLNDIDELESSIILAICNNKIIGYLLYKISHDSYADSDDISIYIEYIEVNKNYRNLSLCKKLITYLINIKPHINKYELYNVGGLSGYSCYVDAFKNNNFIAELQKEDIDFNNDTNNTDTKSKKTLNNLRHSRKTRKLNLTKMENIKLNKEFNCSMKFTRK
jgi:hypothetical protein